MVEIDRSSDSNPQPLDENMQQAYIALGTNILERYGYGHMIGQEITHHGRTLEAQNFLLEASCRTHVLSLLSQKRQLAEDDPERQNIENFFSSYMNELFGPKTENLEK